MDTWTVSRYLGNVSIHRHAYTMDTWTTSRHLGNVSIHRHAYSMDTWTRSRHLLGSVKNVVSSSLVLFMNNNRMAQKFVTDLAEQCQALIYLPSPVLQRPFPLPRYWEDWHRKQEVCPLWQHAFSWWGKVMHHYLNVDCVLRHPGFVREHPRMLPSNLYRKCEDPVEAQQ